MKFGEIVWNQVRLLSGFRSLLWLSVITWWVEGNGDHASTASHYGDARRTGGSWNPLVRSREWHADNETIRTNMDQTSGRVVIVEDHAPTSNLLEQAFEEVAPKMTTECIESGDGAIERFRAVERGDPEPDIVLLDLDLPGKSGCEVLSWRDGRKIPSRIPVVVLSDISSTEAVNQCYDLQAQSFLAKPSDWSGFIDLVEVIIEYWFVHANSPIMSSENGPSSPEVTDPSR